MDVDDIKDIGEEEYTIVNLDSRDMIYNGTQWSIKNSQGTAGLNEFIPYVTSIEVAESFIPDTLYNIDSRNKISYGFLLETYELNRNVPGAPLNYRDEHIKNSIPYLEDNGDIEYPDYTNLNYDIYGRNFVKNIPKTPKKYYIIDGNKSQDYSICYSLSSIIEDDIEVGIKLTFKINKENIDVKNEIKEYGVSKRLIHIHTNDGKINTKNIISLKGTLESDNIINEIYSSYDFSVYTFPTGTNVSDLMHEFDYISTSDDLDILPENTSVDVYYYGTIIYVQQNYDIESFTHTTNKHFKNVFDLHLSRNEEYINNYVSYEEYKNLNLQMEYNTSSKKFEFVSYYNYKFFIDARDVNSIVYVLGLENVLYFSNELDYEYSEKLNTSDEITSFTRNKIEKYYTGFTEEENDLTLYQIFQSKFLDQSILDNKIDDQIFGDNFINNLAYEIKPTYVNNYNFSKIRIYDGSGNFYTSTSSFIFNIIRTSENTNEGTNYYIGVRIKQSDYVFFTKPSLYNIANVMGHKKKDSQDTTKFFHRDFIIYPNSEPKFFYITNTIFNNDMYTNVDLDNRTFIDSVEYKIRINKISAPNISNLSGNRYVDLKCIEIENELKRYNSEMNNLYRYYFDDVTNLYISSSKGNIGDIVLQNPREFNPISRLSTLTLEFRKADGNIYDFKNIPFFISLVIKYLKPKLSIERLEN